MTDTTGANGTDAATPETAQPEAQADQVATLAKEADDLKDRLLRTLAEMENLRRRTEREVADARTYGVTNFARDILAVADNMERAMKALDDGFARRRMPASRRCSTASNSPSASSSR